MTIIVGNLTIIGQVKLTIMSQVMLVIMSQVVTDVLVMDEKLLPAPQRAVK
jgi:hypothetical protein